MRSINLTGGMEAAGRVSFKSRRRPADLCVGSFTYSVSGAERTNIAASVLTSGAKNSPGDGQTRILRFRYDTLVWTGPPPDRISDLRRDVLTNNSRATGLREIPLFKSVKTVSL